MRSRQKGSFWTLEAPVRDAYPGSDLNGTDGCVELDKSGSAKAT